jgi:hypothetical protein
MASKKDTTPSKKKDKYRIRNWREYNQPLVNRGSITFWFDEAGLGRESLYKTLSAKGNPKWHTPLSLVIALGLNLRLS